MEIAALGLKADSSGVVLAAKDLRDMARAAADAERAAVTFAAAETKKARATLETVKATKGATREQIDAAQANVKAATAAEAAARSLQAQGKAARDAQKASESLAKAQNSVEGAFERAVAASSRAGISSHTTAGAFERMAANADSVTGAFNRMALAAAGLFSLAAIGNMARSFIDMADTSNMLEGRLKLVTSSASELMEVQQRLYDVAQGSGSAFESTVELYGRLARSTKSLGVETDTLLTVTNTLQQAFAVSGASTQEATNAIIQMSQGLAAGALRGEEFNSVAEQGSRITELLADSLDMSIGELRAFAAEGGITTQVILDAAVNGSQKVAEEFAKLPPTVEREMTLMRNAVLQSVGEIDTELGITASIARQMKEMRESIESANIVDIIDKWAPSFNTVATAAGLLAGVMAGQLATSLIGVGASAITAAMNLGVYDIATRRLNISATAAATATRGLGAALSMFGGPVGLAVTAIATGIAYWASRTDDATTALRTHQMFLDEVSNTYKAVGGDVGKFAEELQKIDKIKASARLIEMREAAEDAKSAFDRAFSHAPILSWSATLSGASDKMREAMEYVRGTGDITGFEKLLNDTIALDQSLAPTASKLLDMAQALQDADAKARLYDDVVKMLNGDSDALSRVQAQLAGEFTATGNSAAVATGQIQGMSAAMRELMGYVPEMANALKAQDALTKAQVAYQTEVQKLADQFVKDQDVKAYMAGWNEASGALDKARDSITGFTKASDQADKMMRDANRNALPERARRIQEIRDKYEDYNDEAKRGLGMGQTAAQVHETLAKYSAAEAQEISNLNRELNEKEAKRNKAASAADKQAKAESRLENALERLMMGYDEQIELLELQEKGYGKTSLEVLQLKMQYDAQKAALQAKVALDTKDIELIDQKAARIIELTERNAALQKAMESVNQVQDLVSASWVRALEDMILNAESLTDAIKGIGDAWSKASLDALLTGKGPLAQFTGLASNDPNNPNATGGILGMLMGNKVDMLDRALKGLPKSVEAGAESGSTAGTYQGTVDGTAASGVTNWLQQNGKTIMGVGAGLTSLVGAYGVGAAGGSMGMAGLGGAVSGVTGGLSLATGLGLSSAMMGPLAGVGAAIGAGISLYANQQQRKQAKEERIAQAQAAYQEAIPQIQSFTAALRGEITGSLQQTIDEVHQKANELGKAAFFAYQFDEVKRIENEYNAYVDRTRAEFRDSFGGMLDQLSQGGGLAGAFSSAKSEMTSFGEELQRFVADTHYAFQWQGDAGHRANEAAKAAALSLLEPVESLSSVQTAIQQLQGRASGLSDVLVDLGMSSDDAARAISSGVGRAMDALRTSFSSDLTSKLYEAQDMGYVNEMRDVLTEVQQMQADALALFGADNAEAGRIGEYFRLAAQDVVDGAELTGKAFNELVGIFPELSGQVHEFVASMNGALQSTADFHDQLQRKIFGTEGKSHLSTAMDLVTERDELAALAKQIDGDMFMVETYFRMAAQSIVDSSQLTGSAFEELLRWVPELNGQVNEFAAAVQNAGKTTGEFYESMIDKVLGAQGRGYISDMRALITERNELTATAQQLGVDMGLVNQYFALASQNIVDSANLTGDAFQDLLAWFPDLSGSLREAGRAVEQTAAQIEAAAQRLRGFEDRWFNATNDNGNLDGALRAFDRSAAADRAVELAAGGQHLVALERALAAERLNVMADFAAQAVSAAQSAVDAAQQNLQRAAQAAIDGAQAQVDAAQAASQAAAQAVSDAQSRVDAAQQALERAQDAVRQGYEDQAGVLRDTVSRLQSFIKGIQQFKASLALDDSLSPFSPAQQLAEAQRQYQEIAAKALAGDTGAMDQLESVSRNYLSEARDYYASSEAYYQAFNDVQSILDQVASSAQGQLSEAERQLAALDAQIAALTRIDDTVLSIEQAQAELLAAQQDLVTAQQQQAQADSALSVAQANLEAVQSQMDALLGINDSVISVYQAIVDLNAAQTALADAQRVQNDILAQQQALAARNPNEMYVQQLYRDVMGREADASGLGYWTNQMDVGAMSAEEVRRRMEAIRADGGMRFGGIVGSYATGGMVGNGMWDVDSVLARYAGGGNIALAGGEFVTRAPSVNRDTLPTLAAINATGRAPVANDDSARNEIRALRQEVASLKQALVAGFNGTIGAVSQTTSAVKSTENTIGRQRIAR